MKPHVFRMAGWFPVLFLCALQLAVVAQDKVEASVKEKVDVAGTWKWKFEMDNGDAVEPRVQLKQDGDKLTGTFVFRGDTEMEVKEGKIKGDDISFKVFSDRDERKVTTSFAGKISGDTIKGKVETDWSGEKKSYDWEPKRDQKTIAKANAESATGNWQWSFETPNGNTIQSIAKLKQDGTRLSGTVTGRNGMEAEIKDGLFDHGEVSFKVERERNGQKVTTLYNGKLSGQEIKGKIKSDFGGEERIITWEAKRIEGALKGPAEDRAGTANGTWKWSYTGQNGQAVESSAKLKQEGTKLTGTITGRGGVETEIQDGKVENGEISFSTMRERDGTKITTKYRGKFAGNKIDGKTESDLGGTSRSRDWEAQRTRE